LAYLEEAPQVGFLLHHETVPIGDHVYTKQLPAAMTDEKAIEEFTAMLRSEPWVESLTVHTIGAS
jgi:hypothetical protein